MEYSFRATTLESKPCTRCLPLFQKRVINQVTVMPVPDQAPPTSHTSGEPCCIDCQAADTVTRLGYAPDFISARQAVSDDRHGSFLLPSYRKGLIQMNLVQPSAEGDFEVHLQWLIKNEIAPEGDNHEAV